VSQEDAASVRLRRAQVRGRPLLMTDRAAAAEIAGAALELALDLRTA
jgi:LPPG:FO 2-phospho-L-lactate transferase